ncbi:hypothetical protein HK102_000215 [Quaeritorhiza haematococci]|nr:hypothetical protein HK102_000215 [Quaeritorhiza haematococci]
MTRIGGGGLPKVGGVASQTADVQQGNTAKSADYSTPQQQGADVNDADDNIVGGHQGEAEAADGPYSFGACTSKLAEYLRIIAKIGPYPATGDIGDIGASSAAIADANNGEASTVNPAAGPATGSAARILQFWNRVVSNANSLADNCVDQCVQVGAYGLVCYNPNYHGP